MQITLHYDGSFDGLLSTVFHVYACKYAPEDVHITHDVQDTDLFSRSETVTTSPERAQRVFKRLEQQIGRSGMVKLLYGFLIALPEMPRYFSAHCQPDACPPVAQRRALRLRSLRCDAMGAMG